MTAPAATSSVMPDDSVERALELARSGRAAEIRRDLTLALGHFRRAADLLGDREPMPLLAKLLRWQGQVQFDLGRPEEADALFDRSYEVAAACGALSAQASAVNCRAVIRQGEGRLDDATELYRQAARLAAEAGEIRLAGMIEQNLGVLCNIRGDLDGALVRYRSALRAFQEVADDQACSWVLNNMGMLLNDLDLPARAEGAFQRGLEIARRRGDLPLEGVLLANYSEGLIATERWDEAEEAISEALRIAGLGEDRGKEAEALKFKGILARARGQLGDADVHLGRALALAEGASDMLLLAETRRELGETSYLQGRHEEAAEYWTSARALFIELHARLDAERLGTRLLALETEAAGGVGIS